MMFDQQYVIIEKSLICSDIQIYIYIFSTLVEYNAFRYICALCVWNSEVNLVWDSEVTLHPQFIE